MTTTGVWIYPWDLLDHGAEVVAEELSASGVGEVYLAASYHSVAAALGNNPVRGFFSAPSAAVYFTPDPACWSTTPVSPRVADLVADQGDALAAAREAFRSASIGLTGWVVCLHAGAVAASEPSVQLSSPLGRVPNLFCLRAPGTASYVQSLVRDVASRVDAIQLESLHWVGGPHALHIKLGIPAPGLARLLTSWCVCHVCLAAAGRHGADPERLGRDLRALGAASLEGGGLPTGNLDVTDWLRVAAERVRDLDAFLAARRAAVTDLTRLAVSASSVPVDLAPSGNPDITGTDLAAAAAEADRAWVFAYGGVDTVREAVQSIVEQELPTGRVGLGLSLLAGDVETRAEIEQEVELAVAAEIGTIGLYNFGLIPRARASWMKTVVQASR